VNLGGGPKFVPHGAEGRGPAAIAAPSFPPRLPPSLLPLPPPPPTTTGFFVNCLIIPRQDGLPKDLRS